MHKLICSHVSVSITHFPFSISIIRCGGRYYCCCKRMRLIFAIDFRFECNAQRLTVRPDENYNFIMSWACFACFFFSLHLNGRRSNAWDWVLSVRRHEIRMSFINIGIEISRCARLSAFITVSCLAHTSIWYNFKIDRPSSVRQLVFRCFSFSLLVSALALCSHQLGAIASLFAAIRSTYVRLTSAIMNWMQALG